ncbi:hypothetical protein CBS101457_001939 [Exobasidium rhododendri]|nr:hypothetical protein CBS101457_001939 [Exobasidium rhododendri]
MFYSDVILSKKGKLSKVWLAAHAERRMTKAMILDTSIVKSVASIIDRREEQTAVPMALRLSGQLLYGVARIYSRQAKYLLDDCNDALLKLKTAFRSGVVDMSTHTSRSAITLPNRSNVLDLAFPDPNFEGWDVNSRAGSVLRSSTPQSLRSQSYTARLEDISLQRLPDQGQQGDESRFSGFNASAFFDPDAGQDGALLDQMAAGTRRRDSQGREVDANGDVVIEQPGGNDDDDGNSSVGVAREAPLLGAAGRPSLGMGDLTAFDNLGSLIGGDDDGGVDFGLEEFEVERRHRESTPVGTQSLMQDLTPRTALKVQQAAEKRAAAAAAAHNSEKIRKQVVDSRTELLDELSQANGANVASLVAKEQYLPRSKVYMQLLNFHANPSRHILPFHLTSMNSGSDGLDPRLNELLTFDASTLRRRRSPSVDQEGEAERLGKRARRDLSLEVGDEEGDAASIGIGRRAERNSFFGDDGVPDLGADTTLGRFGVYDDDGGMPFDLPALEVDETIALDAAGLRRSTRKRVTGQEGEGEEGGRRRDSVNVFDRRGDLPRLTTPFSTVEGDAEASLQGSFSPSSSNLLHAFDSNTSLEATNLAAETVASTQAGLSKNTIRAIRVLRKQLSIEPRGREGAAARTTRTTRTTSSNAEPKGSFQVMTQSATRRAAAGFFFELLVLGTKDCIKVEQKESFGDILIEAKPTLWTQEDHPRPTTTVS